VAQAIDNLIGSQESDIYSQKAIPERASNRFGSADNRSAIFMATI
jgi:hypothetical protein